MKHPIEFRRTKYPDRALYLWPDEGYWLIAEKDFWASFETTYKNSSTRQALLSEYQSLCRELAKRGIVDAHHEEVCEPPALIYFCPTKFVVSTTDVCNLRCPYCYASSNSTNSRYIDENVFQDGLTFVAAFYETKSNRNSYKLSFVGGEPFLHPKLPAFLEASHESGLLPSVTTNASIPPPSPLISAILNTRCEVNVSLDGPSPEVHRLTRRSSFDSVINLSKSLIAKGVAVSATCVVHSGNLPYLKHLVEVCYASGFAALNFNALNRMGRGTHPEGFTPVSRLDLLHELCRICTTHQEYLPFLSHSAFFSKLFGLSRGMSQRDCGLCNNCFFLDADGRMFLCGALKLDELEVPYRDTRNLAETRKRIDASIAKFNVVNLPECGKCDFRYFCAGDCRGESLAVFGNAYARHPACEDIKESIIATMFELSTGKYDI